MQEVVALAAAAFAVEFGVARVGVGPVGGGAGGGHGPGGHAVEVLEAVGQAVAGEEVGRFAGVGREQRFGFVCGGGGGEGSGWET